MIKDSLKPKIKLCIAMTTIAIIIAFAIFTVMKYQVEGEKKVPFRIGKVIVISSAITTDDDSAENLEQQEMFDFGRIRTGCRDIAGTARKRPAG